MQAKGAAMIDSPVGKTAEHAVAGTLTLMVGGDAADIARVRPVLDCMGTDFFHCGELGAGQTMKLSTTCSRTRIGEASVEALVAGTKAGLTLDTMLRVLRTTMAWNNQLAIAMPKRSLVGDFKPGFMMKLAHKDCRLAVQMVGGARRDGAGRARARWRAWTRDWPRAAGPRRRRAAQDARGGGGSEVRLAGGAA